jgi:large subunit ribosomal protein L19
LTYMRKPKHDMGSVQGIVMQYQRSRAGVRTSSGGGKDEKKGGKRKDKKRK